MLWLAMGNRTISAIIPSNTWKASMPATSRASSNKVSNFLTQSPLSTIVAVSVATMRKRRSSSDSSGT
jgi:hypothetical protein